MLLSNQTAEKERERKSKEKHTHTASAGKQVPSGEMYVKDVEKGRAQNMNQIKDTLCLKSHNVSFLILNSNLRFFFISTSLLLPSSRGHYTLPNLGKLIWLWGAGEEGVISLFSGQ